MPSRKQRRRREKERRHEYELVLVDETGEERPVDPDELRAQRREKDVGRTKGKDGKPVAKGSSRRPVREVKPPSWNRVWKRALFFAVFMFLVLSFVGGKHRTIESTLVPTVLYTVLFVPFLYLLDRTQYNQYLKRSGQQPATRSASRETRPAARGASSSDQKGPVAGLRRAFRR
jgi:hypothetical protein